MAPGGWTREHDVAEGRTFYVIEVSRRTPDVFRAADLVMELLPRLLEGEEIRIRPTE
jgi:hypothetical protein